MCPPVLNEYSVKLDIKESDVTMLNFEMYVGDRERAKKISRYINNNTGEVYSQIVALINTNADKESEEN